MLRTAGFVLIACFALSALSLADARKSKPSATVSPASDFNPTPNTTTSATPTPAPNTTTSATTTPAPNTTTTTTTPKTTTTTPKTTTTTPTTTPTTTNTTTPKTTTTTNTTTTATTTPAPNTTTTATTTPAPNTTTTATTTPAPTTTAPPSPTPPVGDYNLTILDKTCLKAKVALQIRLANKTFTVQPNQTHVNGSCDETRVTLYFNFSQGFINFNFTRDVKTVYVDAVSFSLNYPLTRGRSTNSDHSGSNTSLRLFPAQIGHSYSCKSDSLYMGKGLYLDITNDQMQAFNLTKNDFGSPDFCPADQPDYRVAIAVGVVLLVLIIVVVLVYLWSRRRRMDGYQSL